MYFERGDAALGTAAWERALELAPNDALVNRAIGTQLPIALGVERAEEGVALVERALYELDPLHPPFQWSELRISALLRRPLCGGGRGAAQGAGALDRAALLLALALAQAGEVEAARAEAAEVMRLDPAFSAEAWIANDFYQPGGSSARRFAEGAAKAGLPICAVSPEAMGRRSGWRNVPTGRERGVSDALRVPRWAAPGTRGPTAITRRASSAPRRRR